MREEVDRVRDVEPSVIVRVGRIGARGPWLTEKQVAEERDGIGEVEGVIPVHVSPAKGSIPRERGRTHGHGRNDQ